MSKFPSLWTKLGYDFGRHEDELERKAKEAEKLQFVDYKGQPIRMDQYRTLEQFAVQYGQKAEEMEQVEVKDGLVEILQTSEGKTTKDRMLLIPKELIALRKLYCYWNGLISLEIPKELIELQTLYCHQNELISLVIPKVTALTKVYLSENPNLPRSVIDELRSRGVVVRG